MTAPPPIANAEPPPPVAPASRLAGLAPYQPPTSPWPIDLRLDANEGPTPDPSLLDALASLDPDRLRRYPSATALETHLAERLTVDPARVLVTNGGDDAIDRLCRAVLEPGRGLLLHTPTFEMIEHSGRLAGATVNTVPWTDGPFPTADFIAAITPDTALVALVTPNNPTGGVITTADIEAIADAAQQRSAVVLADLAYVEFADEDPTPALLEHSNIVIVRTFSKARGLAGLRVGYAIAPAPIADWLRAAGGPYPVSSISLALAEASLARDAPAPTPHIARVRSERARLTDLLVSLGADPLDSQANFVAARFTNPDFTHAALASLGVAVRNLASRPQSPGLLRITLPGDDPEFARLTSTLTTALAPQALLLDLDGVIADVSRSYRAAIIETARAFGVAVTPAEIEQAKRAGDANNDWELSYRLISQAPPKQDPADPRRPSQADVTKRFQSLYLGDGANPSLRDTETLIPPPGLLARLAERLPLAIVTGRPRDEAAWFLDRYDLSSLISCLVAMEDAPAKPSPKPLLAAMQRLGAQRAWMLGDTVDDIRAARSAAVLPLGIPAPGDDPTVASETLTAAGAARILTSLSDLEDLLP